MEGMHILKERNVDPKGNPMGIGYLNNDKGNDLLEHREKLGCLCIHCGNVLEQQWQVTKLWANEWKATIEKLEERIEKLEEELQEVHIDAVGYEEYYRRKEVR